MILTCENCQTRYLVPGDAIGAEGREVRCAACHHQWFQEPQDFHQYVEEVEPIPEAVRPVPEGSALPVIRMPGTPEAGRGAGYLAAALVFLLIFTGLVAERGRLIHAWLPSVRFYQALHIAPALPGQGLSLDKITAAVTPDAQGVNTLNLKGHIINTTNRDVKVPPLHASIILDEGTIFNGWQIDPPQLAIVPHGDITFESSYPALPNNAKEVTVNLLLTH
jgi:predicted Zn finger-like uncharacterized protein